MQSRINRFFTHALVFTLLIATLTACNQSKPKQADSKAPAQMPQVVAPGAPAGSTLAAAPSLEMARNRQEASRPYDAEDYKKIDENEFLAAANNPLSTFSIDVDTASYSNVRRFINDGMLPPKDAVRVEEMINYFKYDYPKPQGDEPFSVSTEMTDCPWERSHKLVQVGLQAQQIDVSEAPPSNLVFLIDTSGSMNSPDKLPLLKQAFRLLTNQLRDQDNVAVVSYAGAAGLVLPPTSGQYKERILAAIDKLEAGGSTAGGAGIQLAYNTAREHFASTGNNRVILATDGDFNVGVSSEGELVRLIEEKRKSGIFLTVLGFGTGNLKDAKMEQLANRGNGNYAYIDTANEARKVFIKELGGTLFTIAKDVKVQVEFNPARVQSYRLIGYENRLLQAEDFNDDKKDAGEMGAGHSVTALYEIVPAGRPSTAGKVDRLKYQEKNVRPEAYANSEVMTVKLRYKEPRQDESRLISHAVVDENLAFENASNNLKFAAAVAEFGMLLRGSKFKAGASLRHCLEMARQARGGDAEGYRAEFIRLVEMSEGLSRQGD